VLKKRRESGAFLISEAFEGTKFKRKEREVSQRKGRKTFRLRSKLCVTLRNLKKLCVKTSKRSPTSKFKIQSWIFKIQSIIKSTLLPNFNNFQVLNFISVNHKPQHRSNLMKTMNPTSSRIHVQKIIFLIHHHFQNMRMSRNK